MTKEDMVQEFTALGLKDRSAFEGWEVDVKPNGAGTPSIVVESQALPGGRRLRGNIEPTPRGMPAGVPVELTYFVGISVEGASDFPEAPAEASQPGWIEHVRKLQRCVQGQGLLDAPSGISARAPQEGNDDEFLKMPVVEHYLPDEKWLAKGYKDWALGVRAVKRPLHDLTPMAREFEELITTWYEAEKRAQQS